MKDRIRIEGDIKITVIAKLDTGDLLKEYQNVVHGPCPKFKIGNEFVAKAACNWLAESGCQTLFITLGSSWENGYIESFNDKLRDECLNRKIFRNGKEAQAIVENWQWEYNNYRPHSSLGCRTPAEFARRYYEKNQVREIK